LFTLALTVADTSGSNPASACGAFSCVASQLDFAAAIAGSARTASR
jgi:hypothetical protein